MSTYELSQEERLEVRETRAKGNEYDNDSHNAPGRGRDLCECPDGIVAH